MPANAFMLNPYFIRFELIIYLQLALSTPDFGSLSEDSPT